MKLIKWVWEHILFVLTLFLLAFIPLYPKLPIIDIKNTWVYVRAEDFVVVFTLAIWMLLLIRRKVTLKTPLTLPMLLFWIVGGIATIHAMLLIFPTLANVFPNVALLSYLRRIEYMSLFFIAYSGIKDRKFLSPIIITITITLFLVACYGIGQKYIGFPAYLTMNEEFAKGVPIRLSALSRVPSTFGGHYDLAAYLVLTIPILTSLIFGYKNWLIRMSLLITILLGFIVLFMTVSRVSFFVLLISLFGVLLFQKKRLVLLSFPIVVIALPLLFFFFSPSLLARFGNTVKEIDVLVDAKTGEEIGQARIMPSTYFENKVVKQEAYQSKDHFGGTITDKNDFSNATSSALRPYSTLPLEVVLVSPPNTSTGENLPQGTAYINLSLAPVTKRVGEFFYDKPAHEGESFAFAGDFLVKKASAYDLSFTTRFQGEWPRALEAFKKNILFGSGYSSISLAVDNNYLRILGETGLLGFLSFLVIFVTWGIYIRKVLPEVQSPVVRSFVVGFIAGVTGLALNAVLIDVFEASKVAFFLWLLTGVTLGILHTYQTKQIDFLKEFKHVVTSPYAVVLYLLIVTIALFSPMINNYFIGDDFTWFRWVADCKTATVTASCPISPQTILGYFTESNGFFYRPGTKIYFLLMYSAFWLNQTIYHIVSLSLHFVVAALVFFLARKILQDFRFSVLAAFLFLILSGYSEALFWISSTGFLFNAVFTLLSLLFFIMWEEKKKSLFLFSCIFSLFLSFLFHELGVVTPLLIIMYKVVTDKSFTFKHIGKKPYIYILVPLIPYFVLRIASQSHWFNGDYSYNLLKLPFNIVGNTIGYVFLVLFGSFSLPFYQILRNVSKVHIVLAVIVTGIILYGLIVGYNMFLKRTEKEDKRIIIFSGLFFMIALLPFLGLGNITSRYSYLASVGGIILFVFLLKKLYIFLQSNGKEIALASITTVITVFCLLHIIQIQQLHSDWYQSGEKVKHFAIAIDESYEDYWAKEPMRFYFVNVPLRVGDAWVFPVGLEDILWFSFRNPNIHVYKSSSVQEALSLVDGSKNQKVFEFDSSGAVIERKKQKKVE